MANPIQRRAKNSFLLGFLLALIIMAVVVGLLIYKITKVTEEKEALEAKQLYQKFLSSLHYYFPCKYQY